MTPEQIRVLRLVDSVLNLTKSTNASGPRGASSTTTPHPSCKRARSSSSTTVRSSSAQDVARDLFAEPSSVDSVDFAAVTDRRILVDGVAGAGKTFLLGVFLQKFERVRYLVKKRNFVDATMKRFGYDARLDAQTIDSYLMRHLGIRSLPCWLHKRQAELDDLKNLLYERPVPRDDRELIFVDEYSLIEQSLAELLQLALVHRMVVLVGDCNQQPAIGDSPDQPVRTLLSYRQVCFMYDNVRTKDARLLHRLSHFNARTEDMRFRAIRGLPAKHLIDMSEYFAARQTATTAADVDAASSLIPRVIVVSNDKVNYLNWAIGHLLVRHMTPTQYIRYKRKAILTADALNELAAKTGVMSEWSSRRENGTQHMQFLDDAFADEHFVIVGMRYRMIASQDSWPAQIGSRVVVSHIIDDHCVVLTTDDERAVSFAVHRLRIRPYEFHSRWNVFDTGAAVSTSSSTGASRSGSNGNRPQRTHCATLYMFPFVMDAATTVYQVQGLTLDALAYRRCYVDVQGMDVRALYVTLSRFQQEAQISGVVNWRTLCG